MEKVIFKVTDYVERDLKWEEEECRKLGIHFEYYQLRDALPTEIIKNVSDADIILVNMAKFNQEVISGLKRTKVIIRHGIGYDNVDVEAATRNGIILAHERTASSEDVAEHTVMLMLETYKKRKIQDQILKDWVTTGIWSSKKIYPLYRINGKNVAIIGCGNIGSRVYRKIQGFGVNILVCDPYLSEKRLRELGTQHTPLEEILPVADIITIHLPVTDETKGMFNLDKFSKMKNTAVVINTSRGPVIKTEDLIEALKRKMIAGAGLDVFEKEPPTQDFELLNMDNVVLTPHIAWYSEEGGWDIRVMIMDDLKACLEGKFPRYIVNKEVLKQTNLRFKAKQA